MQFVQSARATVLWSVLIFTDYEPHDVLFNDTWSQHGHSVFMYDHTFAKFSNRQIRHEATHKVNCEPGDCIWSLQSSSAQGFVWVCTG